MDRRGNHCPSSDFYAWFMQVQIMSIGECHVIEGERKEKREELMKFGKEIFE